MKFLASTPLLLVILALAYPAWAEDVRCEVDSTYRARNDAGKDTGIRLKGENICSSKKELRAFYDNIGRKKFASFRQITTSDGKKLWLAESAVKVVGPVAEAQETSLVSGSGKGDLQVQSAVQPTPPFNFFSMGLAAPAPKDFLVLIIIVLPLSTPVFQLKFCGTTA